MATILLVEDDGELGGQVAATLRRVGHEVRWIREGRELEPEALAGVELLILDLMLPGTYGLDILKALRQDHDLPVLVLSARSDTADKVRALQLGADDYMTKPFWPEELLARVRARLRRPTLAAGALRQVGDLELDASNRAVRRGGRELGLSPVEFRLLSVLVDRRGMALTRDWLCEHAMDVGEGADNRILDTHVSRLRKKLGPPPVIHTVWGIGYRFEVEASD